MWSEAFLCSDDTHECSGSEFPPLLGWTTWPDHSKRPDLSEPAILLNVMWSLIPLFFAMTMFGYIVYLWLSMENPAMYKRGTLYEKLAASQLTLKYLAYTVLIIIVNQVQKILIWGVLPCKWIERPAESCLHNRIGFPDEWSIWSPGMLLLIFVDLMMRWSVPHLTGKSNAPYTKDQMAEMGYTAISAQWMVQRLFLMAIILGPVPLSRIVLRDATYMQMLFGLLEGFFISIVVHIVLVRAMGTSCESAVHLFLVRRMIRGGLLAQWLRDEWLKIRGGRSDSFQDDPLIVRDEGLTVSQRLQKFPGDLLEAWRRATTETQMLLDDPSLGRHMLHDGISANDAENNNIQQVLANQARPRGWPKSFADVPGFEFMGVKLDELLESMKDQQRKEQLAAEMELNMAKQKASQELKKHEEEAQKMMQAKKAEFEEQMEKDKEAARQKAEELRIQTEEQMRARTAEFDRQLEEQRRQNAQQLKEDQEKHALILQKQKDQAQKAQDDFEKYQHQLKKNAESLSILQKARNEGNMDDLGRGLHREDIQAFLTDENLDDDDEVEKLFKPVANLAKEVYDEWLVAQAKFREEKRKAESSIQQKQGDPHAVNKCLDSKEVRSLFNSYVNCVERGLVLDYNDFDRKCIEVVRSMLHGWAENNFSFCIGDDAVHKQIITKALAAKTMKQLGNFDATDLESCLQTVDRRDLKFKELAQRQVATVNEGGAPKPVAHLTGALQQLSTLIFFLDFIGKEDLSRTYEQFRTSLSNFKAISGDEEAFKSNIKEWIEDAAASYQPPNTLLRSEDLEGIADKKPVDVIETMRERDVPGMDIFKDIFCMLASDWEESFGVLVVPHHTQVVSLLVFKAFLNGDDETCKTLIGQVSTGEGKSMLIAALAMFVVSQEDESKRKKVHVIGSDEKLVQRDFDSFKGVFNRWREQRLQHIPEKNFAICATKSGAQHTSIPDESWIVYGEAKHVSSYYTQKARTGDLNPELYRDIVLIIDEVDALIVDKDPTDEFVYDIGERQLEIQDRTVSVREYTKEVALAAGSENGMKTQSITPLDRLMPKDAQSTAIHREVIKLVKQVKEWKDHPNDKYKDESGMWYGTDKFGMVNKDYKSNFLEVMRLVDRKTDELSWYERLFVMSKPRVFKLYNRIIGFSGTVGNRMEQEFLSKAYGAHFFVVPPFLKTCKSFDERHQEKQLYFVAEWAKTQSLPPGMKGPAVVSASAEQQMEEVLKLSFHARESVPVLIITKNDDAVKELTDQLENRAGQQHLVKEDVIRPLSKSLFESNPRQYKENLRLSTRCYTAGTGHDKTWRITVTDPSGARGTDYRMDDDDADENGGLLLIVMKVPQSERDWIQYKGRTARQAWKGQYCVLLNEKDYRDSATLPPNVVAKVRATADEASCNELVDAILQGGLEKSKADLKKIQAVYNAGFVANEVCEKVWAKYPPKKKGTTVDVGLEGDPRSAFMKICRMYRYLGYEELVREAQLISTEDFPEGFAAGVPDQHYLPEALQAPEKMVLFVLDVSYSMKEPVGDSTRMAACRHQLQTMMEDPRIIADNDKVGLVAFGYGCSYLLEIGTNLRAKVPGLMAGPLCDTDQGLVQCQNERPQSVKQWDKDPGTYVLGVSTAFFYTLEKTVKDLLVNGEGYAKNLWLIVLTDGEPADSFSKDQAVKQLGEYTAGGNNLIIITISEDVKDNTEQTFRDLAAMAQKGGGVGQYIAAKDVTDDVAIKKAFSNVAEALVDVSGMTQQ